MLWKGLRQPEPMPASRGSLARERREPVEVEVEAGQRSGEVGAALPDAAVERVRVRDLLLVERVVELGRVDVDAARGDDPAAIDRVLVRGVSAAPRTRNRARARGTGSDATQRTVSSASSRARSSCSRSGSSSRRSGAR